MRYICLSMVFFTSLFSADILVPLQDEAFQDDSTSHAMQLTQDTKQVESSISLGYLNTYMKHTAFDILLNGVSLEYNRILKNSNHHDIISSYQINFADVAMRLENPQDNNSSFTIGLFTSFDFLLNQTTRGFHTLSLEGGYAIGIPYHTNIQASQFDEHSLLLNLEYGYNFIFGKFSIIPYIRLESYVFFPMKSRHDTFIDGGMNAILGVQGVVDIPLFECGLNIGALSDLNVSGSSIGILADGTIVFDRDGISNGIFAELRLGILQYKNFHLLVTTNLSYMLSYYELNIKTNISLLYRF